ncbi:hypothetical protein FEE59_13705 [Herbaspirillum sp. RU 5E]|nr:hypothetical protein [Herbaspirillum sp. RU 5E]
MKRNVISRKNLPVRLPMPLTISLGLLIDRLDAPGWVWGVAGTAMAIIWISAILLLAAEEETEVLK